MNILITGASGFVGRHLCRELLRQHFSVRALVRDPGRLPADLQPKIEQVQISGLADASAIASAVVGIDVVIHLAARVHCMSDSSAQEAEYERINHQGTLSVARLAAAAGVRRFIFLSSIKVNGEERALPYSALDAPNPQDAYARSKYRAECGLWALAQSSGLEVVVVRPPLIYGPGVKANFAQLMRWVRRGVPLPLAGLTNRRALVSVDNLIDLLRECVINPKAKGRLFLVSDGESISTTELIRRMAQANQVTSRLFYVPEWLLRFVARRFGKSSSADRLLGSLTVDIAATKALLEWAPPVTMMQTLIQMSSADDGQDNV